MKFAVAQSRAESVQDAVAEIVAQLADGFPLGMLVFFFSNRYKAANLAESMYRAFPGVPQVGCSSAGELYQTEVFRGGIVAMGFSTECLDDIPHVAVASSLSLNPMAVDQALEKLSRDVPLRGLSCKNYVGLVLMDGLSMQEDSVVGRLDVMTDIRFVGGSAADDRRFQSTWLIANGHVHRDAAVFLVFKPRPRFTIIKSQNLVPTDSCMIATEVDEQTRTVFRFDDLPARTAYARALRVPPEQVHEHFLAHPLGLMFDGEIYARTPVHVSGETVQFHGGIIEGTELVVLNSTDILQSTAASLVEACNHLGSVNAILHFQCMMRTIILEQGNLQEPYGQLFRNFHHVGLSTYGEAYRCHINQTSTMLVFGN